MKFEDAFKAAMADPNSELNKQMAETLERIQKEDKKTEEAAKKMHGMACSCCESNDTVKASFERFLQILRLNAPGDVYCSILDRYLESED